MQKLITLLLLISFNSYAQECRMKETLRSKESTVVEMIRNVKAEVVPHGNQQLRCNVQLEGWANGKWNLTSGDFIWNGNYSKENACKAAIELAKKNLQNALNSSTIESESVIVCEEPWPKAQPILNPKVGTILDSIKGLRVHPQHPQPFYHKGAECRWYLETGWNGKDIFQFNGIVCQYGPKWIVVDKF
jgi:hypothetical protein